MQPSLQSLSRFNEDSDLADDSAADPYPLHPLLDGPSNHDWDYLLQRTMSHGQLSAEGQNRTENSSEHERVCPVHGVVHDAEMISPITPLDQVERPRDDEIPGAPQLPTLRRPISATSSAWQELPTSVGLSNPRRPMASLWDSMVSTSPLVTWFAEADITASGLTGLTGLKEHLRNRTQEEMVPKPRAQTTLVLVRPPAGRIRGRVSDASLRFSS